MDIIFQFGEFYGGNETGFWSSFGGHLVTLLGVLITGGFGVYLFNEGIKKERKLNKEFREIEENKAIEKEKQNLEFSKKHFLALTEGAIDSAKKQKDNYTEYAQKVIENPRKQNYPKQRTHEDLIRLLKIDSKEIYRLFERFEIIDDKYIKLYSNFDYLNEIFKMIANNIHNETGNAVVDLTNRLIAKRNEILNISAEFLNNEKANNPNHSENPIWHVLDSLLRNYFNEYDGVPSVEWDFNMLVEPISNTLITDEFRYDALCNTIIGINKECGDIIFSIVDFNKNLANDLLKTCEYIDLVCNSIIEIKDEINTQGNSA